MTGLGIMLVVAGTIMFALGVLAEANHPTGGDRTTGEFMRDGALIAAAGVLFLLLGWLA